MSEVETRDGFESRGERAEKVKELISSVACKDLLSTGSTLLNLICSGDPHGGFLAGKYFFIVGDSTSGKTFLSMTCCAEATINPQFQNYRLIYDNIEDGMLMNLDALFSEEMADRVEPPSVNGGRPVFSATAEDFYYHLDDAIHAAGWDQKKGKPSEVENPRPFVYILDSENSLDSESSNKKFHATKDARRKNAKAEQGEGEEKITGSYGDGKAKLHSEGIRRAMKGLRKTGSILIVLSQTRQNISPYGPRKTRSGGEALRFYATVEIWSSVAQKIKKTVNGKDRQVGVRVALETKKNRITGRLAEAEIDIFPSFGIDDVGTCVDYLCEEDFWTKSGAKITAKGLGIEGTRDKVIRLIEKRNLETKLRDLCGECWRQVEAACALKRKNRYATTPALEDQFKQE